MACHGNTKETCCIFEGVLCPHIAENVGGRRWACGLMVELGDWGKVLADPRYVLGVQPKFVRYEELHGIATNCRDWPPEGMRCDCGDS